MGTDDARDQRRDGPTLDLEALALQHAETVLAGLLIQGTSAPFSAERPA
jgi:hypothetical protein